MYVKLLKIFYVVISLSSKYKVQDSMYKKYFMHIYES